MRIVENQRQTVRPNLTIEFTPEELDVLYVVTGNIGGSSEGPRGITSKLYSLIEENHEVKYLVGPTLDMQFG